MPLLQQLGKYKQTAVHQSQLHLIIIHRRMLKRLKTELFLSQIQKQLQRAKINKSHDFIQPKHLTQLQSLMQVPKSRNQLLNCLYKRMHSSDTTLRLKALIVLHACLRKSFQEDICEVIINEEVADGDLGEKDAKGNIDGYVQKNAINFYLVYLKKMCIHKQSYCFIKRFTRKQLETEYTYRNQLKHEQNLEITTHGFKILNLTNYIFQSQQMFNKMGRYHIENQEILSMYMQLLEDLNHFNAYIKMSVRAIMDRNNESKISLTDCISDYPIELPKIQVKKVKVESSKDKVATSATQAETSSIGIKEDSNNFSEEQAQEIKHYFLYIYECQKVSDRLYEYYHNRYYYKMLRNMIIFPTFLTIENKDYTKMKNKTKRVDRNLVNLVRKSKYDGETSMYTGSLQTQPSSKINETFSYGVRGRNNFTEVDEQNMSKDPYRNISYNFLPSGIEETVQETQE